MRDFSVVEIDIDKVLVTLFCCYAFSMPFELILEILLSIRTIFKPFRILSILIIGVFALKAFTQGLYLDERNQADWLLYAVFIYGLFISCVRIIGGMFDMGLFFNDSFQFGLHVATFFVFKATPISKKEALTILNWFVIGISINAFYIVYQFIVNTQWGRQSGFTDNPNYVAFGLVAVMAYLLLKTNFSQKKGVQFMYALLLLFLFYAFGIEGSRTGLVMLFVVIILTFLFLSLKRKIILLLSSGIVAFPLLLGQLGNNIFLNGPMVLVNRLNQHKDAEEDVRFVVWRNIFKVLEEEGYMGMGIGQFKADFPTYFGEVPHKLIMDMVDYGYYLSTHNDYLAILTDYGLLGLLFYSTFLTVTFWKLFQQIYHSKKEEDRLLGQFCFIGFICIIIFGMAAENFLHQLYWFLLMFTTKDY